MIMAKRLVNLYARIESDVKIPENRITDVVSLSETQLQEELKKGYADMVAGRTKSTKNTFSNIHKEYNLEESNEKE